MPPPLPQAFAAGAAARPPARRRNCCCTAPSPPAFHPGPRQATRQLARMGLPPELAARLAARNLVTARDLFARTLLDLVELLDLPYEAVRAILRDVAVRIVPQPQSVRRRTHGGRRSTCAEERGWGCREHSRGGRHTCCIAEGRDAGSGHGQAMCEQRIYRLARARRRSTCSGRRRRSRCTCAPRCRPLMRRCLGGCLPAASQRWAEGHH